MRAILFVAAIAACSSSTEIPGVAAQQGACTALEGRTFTSTPQADCGLPAPGSPPSTCYWHLAFDASTQQSSTVRWQWSDVEETFAVACSGADVKTTSTTTGAFAGTYDTGTGNLVWNDVTYHE